MGKFKLNNIPKKERIKLIGSFYDAINCAQNREELRFILRDLLTPDEIGMLAKRIEVALLLLEGQTFDQIVDDIKVSKDKINNVRHSLEIHGEGYKLIQKGLEKKNKKSNK